MLKIRKNLKRGVWRVCGRRCRFEIMTGEVVSMTMDEVKATGNRMDGGSRNGGRDDG